MKRKTRSLISLSLGILGGTIASVVVLNLSDVKSQEVKTVQHEIVGPSVRPVSYPSGQVHEEMAEDGRVDLRYAAKVAVPAVVHVKTIQMGKEYVGNPLMYYFFGQRAESRDVPYEAGYGSGVIISGDGYIITNNHVIRNAEKVLVVLNDNTEYEAKIIGQDQQTDLALLKIEAAGLPYLEYGNSEDVSLGEWVLAVGNPYNLRSTVTAGIISAKARDLGKQMSLESFLQTDAAVNPGNSGGALVNSKGELIGINTLIQSPTGAFSGYAFAIPANIARKVVNDLKEYGKVQKAVLGIRMSEVTPALADSYNLKENYGIYVGEALRGGAAEKAGIREGDIIQGMNGVEIRTSPEFFEQLSKYSPGSEIELKVKRKGNEKNIRVTLLNTSGDTTIGNSGEEGILGIKVAPLNREERYRYRLTKGVKITEISNGKFKAAGLDKGYIIVKINDNFIYDEDDLIRMINSITDGGVFVTALTPRGRVEYFAFSLLN